MKPVREEKKPRRANVRHSYLPSLGVELTYPCQSNKKGHHHGYYQVSFFHADGVSCRARAEEASPTTRMSTRP